LPGAVTGVGIGVTVTGTVGTSTSTTITILIGTTSTGTTLITDPDKVIVQGRAVADGNTTRRIAAMRPMEIGERPIASEVGRRDKDALARVIVPAADKA